MRYALQAAAAALATVGWSSQALPSNCWEQALGDLKRLAPRGYAIYEAVRDQPIYAHAHRFWGCDNAVSRLTGLVRGAVLELTWDSNAYPLIDGGVVQRLPKAPSFFPPGKKIAERFDRDDMFVGLYLHPGMVASHLRDLLDALNASSHGLATAVKLVPLLYPEHDPPRHRDELAALMAFVMRYVDVARESVPDTWAGLQRPEVKQTVATIWTQGETALAASCSVPGLHLHDAKFIAFLADAGNGAGLAELLGRAPQRPCQGLEAAMKPDP